MHRAAQSSDMGRVAAQAQPFHDRLISSMDTMRPRVEVAQVRQTLKERKESESERELRSKIGKVVHIAEPTSQTQRNERTSIQNTYIQINVTHPVITVVDTSSAGIVHHEKAPSWSI